MLLLGLAVGLALTFSYMNAQLNQTQAELAAVYSRPIKTDTVVVNRVFRDTVRIVVRSKPKTVYVYTQPDTVRRKRLERDTLIGGVRLNPRMLEVEMLTPKGVSILESYPILECNALVVSINNKGQVNIKMDEKEAKRLKRQKAFRRATEIGALALAFTFGTFIGH